MSLEFTEKELAAFRQEYAAEATDSQFTLFIAECERRGLRPGAHLVFQLRNSRQWDSTVGAHVFVKKPYSITTIAALLLIAERTGKYDGASAPEYIYLDDSGNPSIISEIPLPHPNDKQLPREPWAVRVKIRRKDFSEPITSVVRFDSVAATMKKDNAIVLTDMWQKRGPEQNAKCSLANGIRIGFPEEAGQLYLSEEIKNETEEVVNQPISPTVAVPLPPPVPAVNQAPAEGKAEPRPGEVRTEHHVTEVPATLPAHCGDTLKVVPKETAKDKALAAVPDLKPASEIEPPKKRGRKPKDSPNNGHVPGEITDADIPKPGEVLPEPEGDPVANQQAATEFVESLDPTPTKEEQAGFSARVRALASAGALNADLKNYILNVGGKSDPKQLTVGNWSTALAELETLDRDKLKEVTKNAQLPIF